MLIYGANGYTGRLAAQHAVERGLRPVLAGRSTAEVRALADELGFEWRAFPLDNPAAVREALDGITAVLHAAGPFSATSKPMADACIATGTHYIDITGEIPVFEALVARDAEARDAGTVLLPGAGFDVVPSDCLAAHVKQRLRSATRLRLGIQPGRSVSRGTARTMIEGAARGTAVRRNGRIVELAEMPTASIDFGDGPRPSVGVGWGDVATAWRSTRIPDISVYFRATRAMRAAARAPRLMRNLLGTSAAQHVMKRLIDRMPPGPDAEQRARGSALVVAEAWDDAGLRVMSRLETMEPYALTARTAVEVARRVVAGEVVAGFHTPASAFGADFILEFDRSLRTDVQTRPIS